MYTYCFAFSQTSEDQLRCYNGIKDSLELGVDCGANCEPCNGEVQIVYNTKEYKSGKIYFVSEVTENLSGRAIEKNRIKYFDLHFPFSYIKNGVPAGFGIYLRSLRLGKIEPKKIILTGGNDKDFEHISYTPKMRAMLGGFSENIVFLSVGQLKDKGKYRYVFEITKVDNLERIMSGKIELLGMTTDGTPVDIKGTFENVSY
jgi:hypothetical protein